MPANVKSLAAFRGPRRAKDHEIFIPSLFFDEPRPSIEISRISERDKLRVQLPRSASSSPRRSERDWTASWERGGWSLPPSKENLMNERVPHSLLTGEQP